MRLYETTLLRDTYVPMSKDEERLLFSSLKGIDDARLNATLVRRNARLAMKVATWAAALNRDVALTIDDYLQLTLISMVKAIGRFDAGRNVRFATFAYKTMRQDIIEFWGTRGKYVDAGFCVSLDDVGHDGNDRPLKDILSTGARIADDSKAGLKHFSAEVARSEKIAPLAKKMLITIANLCLVDGESKAYYSRERAAKMLGLKRGYCFSQFGETTIMEIHRIVNNVFRNASAVWPSGGGANKHTNKEQNKRKLKKSFGNLLHGCGSSIGTPRRRQLSYTVTVEANR